MTSLVTVGALGWSGIRVPATLAANLAAVYATRWRGPEREPRGRDLDRLRSADPDRGRAARRSVGQPAGAGAGRGPPARRVGGVVAAERRRGGRAAGLAPARAAGGARHQRA